uniref:Peptidase A1 domain-containing protein n=1 Tax=Piliocolobus tephrosceles TaxID=591936 RepID=A0A8C9GGI7_9PRIM
MMLNKFVYISLFLFLQVFLSNYALCDFLKNLLSKTNHYITSWENIKGTSSNYLKELEQLGNNNVFKKDVLKHDCFLQTKENNNVILLKLYKQDIPSKKISTYYGQISIGEKLENRFNVLFDTGSTEFWIPFEKCKGPNFNSTHDKYKRTNSFKYKYNSKGLPSVLEVDYLSGKITGFDGYDTVNLGMDLAIPDTNIAFATYIDIPVLEDFKWDGIVGLGFENEDSKKRGIKPFFDHIKDSNILTNKNYKNMFGYYLTDTGNDGNFDYSASK